MTTSLPADTDSTTFTHSPLRPFGRIVEAHRPMKLGDAVSPEELAAWTIESRVLVLRGFELMDTAEFADYCRRWGEVLEWPVGEVVDLVVEDDPKNYLFASGDVPFHWDGAFVEANPRWFFFQCLDATPDAGGDTVFCDTTAAYRDASARTREQWAGLKLTYKTETIAHYGGEVTERLIAQHPATGLPVLRFAEPLDPDVYKNPVSVTVEGLEDLGEAEFLGSLAELLHRDDYCYHHRWQAGDILIADNFSLIHGRDAFTGPTTRHLQRVEVI